MSKKNKTIVILLFMWCFLAHAQFVKNHGQLSVKGTQLVDKNQNPVVLRGVSFGWHSMWSRFYNKKAVAWLKKDFNSTVIRAAIGIEEGHFSYKNDSVFALKKLTEVVDAAIKNQIYVIIDWHSHNIKKEEAKYFFEFVSKKYKTYPNIIYEIYNEPDHETWPEVKAYSEEIIKVIRANDPNNVILVGSPHWDQDLHLVAADPVLGFTNIMYSFHFYAGTHKKELRDRVDAALQKGIPIFVSESAGMEATGNGPMDYTSWYQYIDWMEDKKISWITWSISDKVETCSMLKNTANSSGNWKDQDLNESGFKTRELLRKYNK